ncbi:MAG: hypothetical protein ACTTJ6_02280 [Treponema sp.]
MDNEEILRPLLEKGDLEQTLEFVKMENKRLSDVINEGMNIVTASVLADIPSVEKSSLIQRVGTLFSTEEYCTLLNKKIFTISPEKRERLRSQGLDLVKENTAQYMEWYNIFDIAFPWLPLSVFEDFVIYLKNDKKLELDAETIEQVKENFLNSKRYSERELDKFFSSSLFKGEA